MDIFQRLNFIPKEFKPETIQLPWKQNVLKMADAAKGGGKEPANIVHQQAILVETILKEERHQKLFTNYSINPFRKSN